jgi:hypothetical protein
MVFNWLRRKVQVASVESARQDLRRYLDFLAGADPEEIAMIVVAAELERRNLFTASFRGDHTAGLIESAITDESIGEFTAEAPYLATRRLQVHQREGNPTWAAGMTVWVHTLRVYRWPELRLMGRAMWKELMRGHPAVGPAISNLGAAGLSNIETDCLRVPETLRPSEEPG